MKELTADQIKQAKQVLDNQIKNFQYEMEHSDLNVAQYHKLQNIIDATKAERDSLDHSTSKSGSIEL
jgi:hypothetical protein